MSQTYTTLSPWAKSDYLVKHPITSRLSDLAGKTIGDHGGPVCKAAMLPANFEVLAQEYRQELGRVDY